MPAKCQPFKQDFLGIAASGLLSERYTLPKPHVQLHLRIIWLGWPKPPSDLCPYSFIYKDYIFYVALNEVAPVLISAWSPDTAHFANKKSATLTFFHFFQCSKCCPISEPCCTLHLSRHSVFSSYFGNHLLKDVFPHPSDKIRTHLLLILRVLCSLCS